MSPTPISYNLINAIALKTSQVNFSILSSKHGTTSIPPSSGTYLSQTWSQGVPSKSCSYSRANVFENGSWSHMVFVDIIG
jgi:hypothetical protein